MHPFHLTFVIGLLYTGSLSHSASNTELLHWFGVVSLAVPRLTCVNSAVQSISFVLSRRALRSASSGKLLVPRVETSTCQRRAFSVVGPSVWNSLPLQMRLLPRVDSSVFYKLLKTFLFHRGWTGSASEWIS